MYKIVHLNSLGCDITDTELVCSSFDDVTDTNDKLREYILAVEVWPGDTLKVVEI